MGCDYALATTRTVEVISELYASLDMENGGEIAETLAALYGHIIAQMPMLNFSNDVMISTSSVDDIEPTSSRMREQETHTHKGGPGVQGDRREERPTMNNVGIDPRSKLGKDNIWGPVYTQSPPGMRNHVATRPSEDRDRERAPH